MSENHNPYQKWRESEAYFSTGYKQAMKDVISLLMIQHEAAKERHNYWHVAANLVRTEFLPEEKNT